MAGVAPEESGDKKSSETVSSGQQKLDLQSGETLAEWRSLDQVENGSPSTSPSYWDTDDDNDGGQNPSDLYGKYTWKIDKFSQLNKREHRSEAFEAGGFKWYILIYPQGCDVCNHLSLFLCVANHDRLLPGWSHFAQFTIAVVNKDPKKSKYSDTLHRFWKKEHDWGWKKFMELSKLLDGFIDADTLIIKAQVQVIRERADQPFRCLDCQYRRELVRVYLTNVEQVCRRFVEEQRTKLGKLIEDKARWSSFRAFWMGKDQSSRHCMSREKTESILKVVVKHFFIEKEVTSTLVMDSLYSGLKALKGRNKGKKSKGKYLEAEELPVPIVCIENDTFALVDDVLLLLERAAIEPLPPKDEKGPQNRTKDGTSGEEFNKDFIVRDERRLTALGRRTIEIFALSHIFSKIEIAYQEVVALKKQEELIREEEEAWLVDLEQKARRRVVEKEKKSKKKQKQKRNNRKGKDNGRDEKASMSTVQVKVEENSHVEMEEIAAEPEIVPQESEVVEVAYDVSEPIVCAPELVAPDSEDRDLSPVNWDTDNSEVQTPAETGISGVSGSGAAQTGMERGRPSVVDDSSSTCSSDSVPSSVVSVASKGKLHYHNNPNSTSRVRSQRNKSSCGSADWVNVERRQPVPDARHSTNASRSSHPQVRVQPLPERLLNGAELNVGKKSQEEESKWLQRNANGKGGVDAARSPSKSAACVTSSPSKIIPLMAGLHVDTKADTVKPTHASAENISTSETTANPRKFTSPKPAAAVNASAPDQSKTLSAQEAPAPAPALTASAMITSRPLSAPVVPSPVVSTVQKAAHLARSVSTAGRLGPEPTNQSYAPHSYRNTNTILGGYSHNPCANFVVNNTSHSSSSSYSQRAEPNPVIPLGISRHPELLRGYDVFSPCGLLRAEFPAPDEFPHLDIINDLLDDDAGYQQQGFSSRPHHYLNRHYSFPGEPPGPSCRFDRSSSGRTYDVVNPITQSSPRPYLNDNIVPPHWQMGDLPFVSVSDGGSYPYIPEYGGNPVVYRPSNGL